MANLTLNGWKASVAAGVVESLPLQDFESALVLADDFLASQGGWNPDDAGDPTGPGEPVSGVTTEEAIILLTQTAIENVYHVDVDGTMTFRIIMNEQLSSGLTEQEILDNIADRLEDVVELNLRNTNIELQDVTSFTGDITNGPTTQQQRIDIQNLITGGGRIIEPMAIGLIAARASFSLDNFWNVEYLYTEQGKPFYLSIIKYETTTYATPDTTVTETYGVTLDSVSYRMTGGVVVPVEQA